MPLSLRKVSFGKERFSHLSIAVKPLEEDSFKWSFTNRFEIPADIPVDGIVFGQLNTVDEVLLKESLLPAINRAGIDAIKPVSAIKTTTINLPDVFSEGSLTIANAPTDNQGDFLATLQFRDGVTVEYQTPPGARRGLYPLLRRVALLALLPDEVFDKVEEKRPFVIISQPVPNEHDDPRCYTFSTILSLQRRSDNVIFASQIPGNHGKPDMIEQYVNRCKDTIANSSGVFFVLDGFLPQGKQLPLTFTSL